MAEKSSSLPIALTIAGLDPSGGAGILADVRAFAAFGCFPTAAITSLTFQNTTGVVGAVHQSGETVRAQVLPIIEDFAVDCAKTGMLPTREVIAAVARLFREAALPAPVVDPVMRATSGDDLIDDDAVSCLVSELFPLARLVTPNIPEAERLTGLTIVDEEGMSEAAQMIRARGARAVLVKGGHLGSRTPSSSTELAENVLALENKVPSREAIDVLNLEGRIIVFRAEMIGGREIHGSGCTLSAAIAACLGRRMDLEESVDAAKRFITAAIKTSPAIGHGARPLFFDPRTSKVDE